MQNHSLDNLFGTYPGANGLNASLPSYSQVDAKGNPFRRLWSIPLIRDPTHNRPTYVASWDNGSMDKFALAEGDISMQYYDNTFSGLASDNTPWSIAKPMVVCSAICAGRQFLCVRDEQRARPGVLHGRGHAVRPHYLFQPPLLRSLQRRRAGQKITAPATLRLPLTATTVGDQTVGRPGFVGLLP